MIYYGYQNGTLCQIPLFKNVANSSGLSGVKNRAKTTFLTKMTKIVPPFLPHFFRHFSEKPVFLSLFSRKTQPENLENRFWAKKPLKIPMIFDHFFAKITKIDIFGIQNPEFGDFPEIGDFRDPGFLGQKSPNPGIWEILKNAQIFWGRIDCFWAKVAFWVFLGKSPNSENPQKKKKKIPEIYIY